MTTKIKRRDYNINILRLFKKEIEDLIITYCGSASKNQGQLSKITPLKFLSQK